MGGCGKGSRARVKLPKADKALSRHGFICFSPASVYVHTPLIYQIIQASADVRTTIAEDIPEVSRLITYGGLIENAKDVALWLYWSYIMKE